MLEDDSVFESDTPEDQSPLPVADPATGEPATALDDFALPTAETHYIIPRDEIEFRSTFRRLMDEDPLIKHEVTNRASRRLQAEFREKEKAWEEERERLRSESLEQRQVALRAQFSNMTPEQFGQKYATDPEFRRFVYETNKATEEAARTQRPEQVDPFIERAHENILSQLDESEAYLPLDWVEHYRQQYFGGALSQFDAIEAPQRMKEALAQAAAVYAQHRTASRTPAPPQATAPPPAQTTTAPPARQPVAAGNPVLAGMRSDMSGRAPAPRTGQPISERQWQQLLPDQMEATLRGWGLEPGTMNAVQQARGLGLIR